MSLSRRVPGAGRSRIVLPGAPVEPLPVRNWNPGNYITQNSYDSDSLFNAIANRLSNANDPDGHWEGVMIRKPWRQLEVAFNDYSGLDAVANRLGQIAALNGRHLMLFIQIKTFNTRNSSGVITSYNHAVPDYMRASATYADPDGYTNDLGEHGEYGYKSGIGGPGGYVPNMHVAAVRERWEALCAAIATRFNDHPNLEAVVINEASISQPYQIPSSDEWPRQDEWFANMATAFTSMKAQLTNIQICQWINGPRPKMSTQANYTAPRTGWVPDIADIGIGLGMTDLCINDVGFQYVPPQTPGGIYFDNNPGNIFLIQNEGQGNAIVVGHASAETYRGSVANRNQGISNDDTPVYPGPQQTRQQTRDFAVNTVGCTHIVWAHNVSADPYETGMTMSEATDAFIHNPASNITTVSARPAGW